MSCFGVSRERECGRVYDNGLERCGSPFETPTRLPLGRKVRTTLAFEKLAIKKLALIDLSSAI